DGLVFSAERKADLIALFAAALARKNVRFAAPGHQAAPVMAGLQTATQGAQRHPVVEWTRASGGSGHRTVRAMDRGHSRRRGVPEFRSPAAFDPSSIRRTRRKLRRLFVGLRRVNARTSRCAH